jgi:hypothetical protein
MPQLVEFKKSILSSFTQFKSLRSLALDTQIARWLNGTVPFKRISTTVFSKLRKCLFLKLELPLK